MTENIKKLLEGKREAAAVLRTAASWLAGAVLSEMYHTLPAGMKVVSLVIEYEGHDDDRVDEFHAAVPGNFEGDEIRGHKYHNHRGSFEYGTPVDMLVFDENEYSLTWLQWQSGKKVFEDFAL